MVVPYKEANTPKKEQVRQMFDNIAPKYDFLNHFLTAGIDKSWRVKVCKIVEGIAPQSILDMASGTGDLAIQLSRITPNPNKILGIDISEKMLNVGRNKVQKRNLAEVISFQTGDAENIEVEDSSFDVVTCAFGVRNFENIDKGLTEFYRVLNAKGTLVILELSIPENALFRLLYNVYFKKILPLWGRLFSKDKSAYSYLPESVVKFPKNADFVEQLKKAGFTEAKAESLTFGIATIFVANK